MPKSVTVNLPAVTEEKQAELMQQLGMMDRLKQAFMKTTQPQKPTGWVPTEKVVGPMFNAGVLRLLPKLAQYVTPEEAALSPELGAFIDKAGRILKLTGKKGVGHDEYIMAASTEYPKVTKRGGWRIPATMAKEQVIRLLKSFNELNLEHYTEPTLKQRTTGSRIIKTMRNAGEEPTILYEMNKIPGNPQSSWPNRVSWPEYLRKIDEIFGQGRTR